MFEVVEDLAVDPQLDTFSLDKCIQNNFSAECMLVPWHLQPVDILTQSPRTSTAIPFAYHGYATAQADRSRHYAVVAKPVTLAPCLHTPVMQLW